MEVGGWVGQVWKEVQVMGMGMVVQVKVGAHWGVVDWAVMVPQVVQGREVGREEGGEVEEAWVVVSEEEGV
jgi:hypothetical protein